MTTLLKGGAAFITGAGSGIGQYTAYALACHGVRQFAICDVKGDSLQTTAKQLQVNHHDVEVLPIEMDVSQELSVQDAINRTVKQFSRIDYAINNAGIGGNGKPTHENNLEDWQKVISVNLTGVSICQRLQIRQMLTQSHLSPPPRGSRGTIINIASMLGLVGCSPSIPATAYTASKHGVLGLTRTDAIAYARQAIRINAICPGYIATPLLKQATGTEAMRLEVEKVPQGRLGEMEEVADAVVFLASEMSSFMCGTGMVVDGGYTAQ